MQGGFSKTYPCSASPESEAKKCLNIVKSVAKPHHFEAAPTHLLGKNFDAAQAPDPAPTLNTKIFLKTHKG
jgi:hypothetical protein